MEKHASDRKEKHVYECNERHGRCNQPERHRRKQCECFTPFNLKEQDTGWRTKVKCQVQSIANGAHQYAKTIQSISIAEPVLHIFIHGWICCWCSSYGCCVYCGQCDTEEELTARLGANFVMVQWPCGTGTCSTGAEYPAVCTHIHDIHTCM